jgi:hypothetical protein
MRTVTVGLVRVVIALGLGSVAPVPAEALVACVKPNGVVVVLDQCLPGQVKLNVNAFPGPGAATAVIRLLTQTIDPGSSHTFTAFCQVGEIATGGGWRMEGGLPTTEPPVTVLGSLPVSSSPEPIAGEHPRGCKVLGVANHDTVNHDVTVFAICVSF